MLAQDSLSSPSSAEATDHRRDGRGVIVKRYPEEGAAGLKDVRALNGPQPELLKPPSSRQGRVHGEQHGALPLGPEDPGPLPLEVGDEGGLAVHVQGVLLGGGGPPVDADGGAGPALGGEVCRLGPPEGLVDGADALKRRGRVEDELAQLEEPGADLGR